jgi:hypothetical protein
MSGVNSARARRTAPRKPATIISRRRGVSPILQPHLRMLWSKRSHSEFTSPTACVCIRPLRAHFDQCCTNAQRLLVGTETWLVYSASTRT